MATAQKPDLSMEETLTRMVGEWQLPLLRTCCAVLGSEDLAKDAVQETFLKAYRGLPSFRGECSEKNLADAHCRQRLPGYALGNKILQTGRLGRYVYNLQLGLGITVDGLFGSGTESKVRDFQRANGLTADGYAGDATKSELWKQAETTIKAGGK